MWVSVCVGECWYDASFATPRSAFNVCHGLNTCIDIHFGCERLMASVILLCSVDIELITYRRVRHIINGCGARGSSLFKIVPKHHWAHLPHQRHKRPNKKPITSSQLHRIAEDRIFAHTNLLRSFILSNQNSNGKKCDLLAQRSPFAYLNCSLVFLMLWTLKFSILTKNGQIWIYFASALSHSHSLAIISVTRTLR